MSHIVVLNVRMFATIKRLRLYVIIVRGHLSWHPMLWIKQESLRSGLRPWLYLTSCLRWKQLLAVYLYVWLTPRLPKYVKQRKVSGENKMLLRSNGVGWMLVWLMCWQYRRAAYVWNWWAEPKYEKTPKPFGDPEPTCSCGFLLGTDVQFPFLFLSYWDGMDY